MTFEEQKLAGEESWEVSDEKGAKNNKDLFLKLNEGKNEIRILTTKFMYFQHEWVPVGHKGFPFRVNCAATSYQDMDNCPMCVWVKQQEDELTRKIGPENDANKKQFEIVKKMRRKKRWYAGVIDRKTSTYKILDFKSMIEKQVKALVDTWGPPSKYDLKITVNKSDPSSYYTVINMPPKPLSAQDLELQKCVDLQDLSKRVIPPTPEQVKSRMDAILKTIKNDSVSTFKSNTGSAKLVEKTTVPVADVEFPDADDPF